MVTSQGVSRAGPATREGQMWVRATRGFQVQDGHFRSPRMREGHMRPGPRVCKTCTRAQHGFHGWGTVRIGRSQERRHSLQAPAPTEETLILGITDWGKCPVYFVSKVKVMRAQKITK